MEKETITIKIWAECDTHTQSYMLADHRTLKVEGTRGEVAKKLDEICADIETSFEQ
jgi:hypothetical protein